VKTFVHRDVTEFFLGMRIFLKKERYRENQNTFYSVFFKNRTVYEIMWKNVVEPYMP
jgi:hypothetical protein